MKYERTTTQTLDLDKANIRIYRAEQSSGFGEDGDEPGPLDGLRVMEIRAPDMPVEVIELPPALDQLIEQALEDYAGKHGLTPKGAPQ